jgi:hypothetical protein
VTRLALAAVVALAAGCASDGDATTTGPELGRGCPGAPTLAELPAPPRFAVVLSDYASSAVAVLDAEAEPLAERWIDSGTRAPGLVAALSGDVDLPTRQAGDGTFTLLDRFRTDVVSRFCVPDGSLVGQVRTHGSAAGFSSNPQDFVVTAEHDAWASRFEPNLDPSAPPEEAGDDLVHIDPTTMERTGGRIDLSPFGAAVRHPDSAEATVPARPQRLVQVGDRLVVGLARLGRDLVDAAGEGAVAVVALETGDVTVHELSGLANCGRVVPVPEAPQRVLVACEGFGRYHGDEPATRATAGLVLLDVLDGVVAEAARWSPASGEPLAVTAAIGVGATRAVAVAAFGDAPAELYLVDLETGGLWRIHAAGGPFDLGVPAYDADTGRLVVPDAGVGIALYRRGPDGFARTGERVLASELGLPPRLAYVLE